MVREKRRQAITQENAWVETEGERVQARQGKLRTVQRMERYWAEAIVDIMDVMDTGMWFFFIKPLHIAKICKLASTCVHSLFVSMK